MIDESIVKLRPDTVSDMCKLVIGFAGSPYLEEFFEWYGRKVNPKELTPIDPVACVDVTCVGRTVEDLSSSR